MEWIQETLVNGGQMATLSRLCQFNRSRVPSVVTTFGEILILYRTSKPQPLRTQLDTNLNDFGPPI